MKYIVIGGVAGGASAAARLRRIDEHAEIVMLERGKNVSFANCGLPYHIGGVIQNRSDLLVQSRENLCSTFDMDIRVRSEVIRVDPAEKTVTVRDLSDSREYQESYDKLLLSPGAEPVRPPIPGIDSDRITALRSLEDMDRIIEIIRSKQVKRAVVVGAGFIGIEIAENLRELDIETAVVEKMDQVLAPVDFEIAAQVHEHVAEHGVDLYLENGVCAFEPGDAGLTVQLEDGTRLPADMVILSIGVRPETWLAKEAGLEIGSTGGIQVNEYLQTSDPSIFAVGDAVEVAHIIGGKKTLIPLAWPANRQGRIVADTMTGRRKRSYRGSLGTSILKVFDLTVAAAGMNEKLLARHDISFRTVTVSRKDHAGYYPGAESLVLKLLFSPQGEILGAQGIGRSGVDKRIDLIAAAVKGGMNIWDLQDLEVAYAPPYNAAKDPVNIAGYAAENILEGMVSTVSYHEVDSLLQREDTEALDVRTPMEHRGGAIPGSLNISVDQLRSRLDELDRSKTYLVYCKVGHRGYLACRMLTQHGFQAVNLDGGYDLWLPVFRSRNGLISVVQAG